MINFANTEFITSYGVPAQIKPSEKPEVVLCGRSNVGKSSLLNKLCNRKNLARVSSKPGKTCTVNLFSLGKDYLLTDLPGYGFARRSYEEKIAWGELMEGFFASYRNMQLALLLLDSRLDPNEDDMDMIKYFNHCGIPYACILTKTDKLNKTEFSQRVSVMDPLCRSYGAKEVIPFSVNNMEDVNKVQTLISTYLEK